MGEAQDLIDKYGWGGEDDDYDHFYRGERRPSQRGNWKNRNSKRKLITEPEAIDLAHQIARLNEKIKDLQSQEKIIRRKLEGSISLTAYVRVSEDEALSNDYIVEHLSIYKKEQLNQKRALQFILNKYGYEALLEFAEKCSIKSKKKTAIYVRPFPKGQPNLANKPDSELSPSFSSEYISDKDSLDDDIPF